MYESSLLADSREQEKFLEVRGLFYSTIDNTLGYVVSLQDSDSSRYKIHREVWDGNLEILRKIDFFDVTKFQEALLQIEKIRTNYDITLAYQVSYLTALRDFFEPKNKISNEQIYKVLNAERTSISMTNIFALNLVEALEKLMEIQSQL